VEASEQIVIELKSQSRPTDNTWLPVINGVDVMHE
jgi:hypothetical protein